MGTYLVQGGKRIEGEFAVRGSKNAALPILAACVLAADEVVLENLPQIRDVSQTLEILRELGCSVTLTERTAVIDSREMQAIALCGEAVRKMRSSILFLGAMLGRSGAGRMTLRLDVLVLGSETTSSPLIRCTCRSTLSAPV